MSLIKAIAERHGADITLSDNAQVLRVTIRFPDRRANPTRVETRGA
ncbi:hypothetical protein DT23_14395 [Thioclava indica]|uniref:Histidine kinase/HSP90-like ATPase domain-containing protein n=2 Tax=Thioclava indica TaxID=1353528 RepID=A0A074KEV3_9RHOB|nr:hypothetical protein [Thioclava indica]KEO60077.1 hypothetical protein DT23_14395 [Thioclava indica]